MADIIFATAMTVMILNLEVPEFGHITDASDGVNLISHSGTLVPITAQGWDAFLKSEK